LKPGKYRQASPFTPSSEVGTMQENKGRMEDVFVNTIQNINESKLVKYKQQIGKVVITNQMKLYNNCKNMLKWDREPAREPGHFL
jgi:hypothetical protein